MSDKLAFESLRGLVAAQSGFDLRTDRHDAFRFALERAIERESVGGVSSFYQRLLQNEQMLDDFIEELTIGETYFFREPGQFQFVREQVVPEILARRGRDHLIRAWSAACSTGEEVYSLAMLFEQAGLGHQYEAIGTDVSEKALIKARLGSYGDWSLRDQGERLAGNYLTTTGNRHFVLPAVRHHTRFARLNLATEDYASHTLGLKDLDLIFCRNVLIYFDREVINRVARRLHDSLNPGGWLITASTDPSLTEAAPFLTVMTKEGVFYRRDPSPNAVSKPEQPRNDPAASAFATKPAVTGFRRDEGVSGVFARKPSVVPAESKGKPVVPPGASEAAVMTKIRSLAEVESEEARRLWTAAIERFPLSGELYYLGGMIDLSLGRLDEAIRAVRRSLYLDPSAAASNFLLGVILNLRNDREGAARAFRNARDFSASRPPDEPVPYAGGETAGRLAVMARVQLARLSTEGATR